MQDKQDTSNAPPGWHVWGNFGDGKWRAGGVPQTNDITPQPTKELAIKAAWEYLESQRNR